MLIVSTFALLASVKGMAAEENAETVSRRIGRGNPGIGQQQSEAGRCEGCHGADGNSSDAKIPNHAGQYAAYLIKQLGDFQSGARKHEIMTIMAEDLSTTDMADIGAYFAGRNIMNGDGSGDRQLGRNLFVNGDPARGILPCAGCHGENGKGGIAGNVVYPVIGGQRNVYLRAQLVNWKLGERSNSPGGVMNAEAKSLSDDEIEALVDYISGL
ncbi:c-type cytochrome [Methylobacter sp.]|uniref:c-type cytochrome n=1 Tax=Methylobacter sp. TaxID=2051955 RepID=UPI002FDD4D60